MCNWKAVSFISQVSGHVCPVQRARLFVLTLYIWGEEQHGLSFFVGGDHRTCSSTVICTQTLSWICIWPCSNVGGPSDWIINTWMFQSLTPPSLNMLRISFASCLHYSAQSFLVFPSIPHSPPLVTPACLASCYPFGQFHFPLSLEPPPHQQKNGLLMS